MNEEQRTRALLLLNLRRTADVLAKYKQLKEPSKAAMDICRAVDEIKSLADKLDFRVADRLSDKISEVARQVLYEECDHMEPLQHAMLVSNDGFEVVLEEGLTRRTWKITCHREEENAGAERTADPAGSGSEAGGGATGASRKA